MDCCGVTCCDPMPAAAPIDVAPDVYEPAPVAPAPAPVAPEPAPVLSFDPPAPPAVVPQPDLTAPAPVSVPAPVEVGSLLGPSTVGGDAGPGYTLVDPAGNAVSSGSLLGPATVGGAPELAFGGPDLGPSTVGGSTASAITWTDSAGNPVAAPEMPLSAGPFSSGVAAWQATANAALAGGILRDGAPPYPAPWTHGQDFDEDGVPNQLDADPRDRRTR